MKQTDRAYPWVAQLPPSGIKGLVFAALSAAIVSSLASMLNSTATIFTMDIFREYVKKDAADKTLVTVGRLTAVAALTVACFIAPQLSSLGQTFRYIQEYTGLVSPGILAVFVCGLFYKKANSKAAITGVLGRGFGIRVLIKKRGSGNGASFVCLKKTSEVIADTDRRVGGVVLHLRLFTEELVFVIAEMRVTDIGVKHDLVGEREGETGLSVGAENGG